jgi:hypothetical protein
MVTGFITSTDVASLREIAESTMVDTCTVTDPATAVTVLNEITGVYDETLPGTVAYTGPCRVRSLNGDRGRDARSGERNWALLSLEVQLPVSTSAAVRPGMVTELLTAEHDADLIGRRLLVDAVNHSTHSAVRRLTCQEVIG